jgi:hypothetical protein
MEALVRLRPGTQVLISSRLSGFGVNRPDKLTVPARGTPAPYVYKPQVAR